jgi:hypothetical protein
MTETETRKRKSKDRDGVYKRRGYWHFDYKDPQTADSSEENSLSVAM